jgi:hypothetical protein
MPAPKVVPPSVQMLNVSTRLRVETGDNVMIGGFIITGNAPKKVVVRGIGLSLSQKGVSDALADPVLELHGPNGAVIFQNDNWRDLQSDQIQGTELQPSDDLESVIIATLAPGAYTAILNGKSNTAGVGLVEVYDADQLNDSQLANISTRGFVQTGDNVMIGGFVLAGNGPGTTVVVRGLGPSITQLGLANALADPTLELHNTDGMMITSNDNWEDDSFQAAALAAAGLTPVNRSEAAIVITLPSGQYTTILAGANGAVGVGLIEVYNLAH